MPAWYVDRYGEPAKVLALREENAAAPGPEDVVVAVRAVALNPVDAKAVAGESKLLLPFAPPFVPGVDFAGEVEAVGSAVRGWKVGDRVCAYTGMARMGAFASRVTVPAAWLGPWPDGWSAAEAATLPLPAICASQGLAAAGVKAGSRVLVHGGAGGVGSLAVMLARAQGAEVLATAGAADLDRVRELGASVVIDHRAQRFEEVARECDVVFDTVGGDVLPRSFAAVRRGGAVVTLHGAPSAEAMAAAGLTPPWFLKLLLPLVSLGPSRKASAAGARFLPQLTVPDGAAIARVAALPPARPRIGRELPFGELPAAFAAMGKGRVVLGL